MTTSIRKTAAAIAAFATAIMPFANATPAFAAAPNWDTTGAYTISFDLGGTPYVHDLSLTQTGASLVGNGGYPAGGPQTYTWILTSGAVDGDSISFTANYTASADAVTPQTTMIVNGTIANDGTMSGTWSDNYQAGARNGTWMSVTGTADPIAPACTPATMILSSDTGTTYKGQTNVNPAASSADGLFTGGSAAAVVAGPDGYPGAWDTAGLNPLVSGASWVNDVSVAPTNANGGQVDTWRLFSESFTLPVGAIVSSATVSFSADNSATAYYDETMIGSVANFSTVTTSVFGASAGNHELEFVTKNDAYDGATNPTAIIYKATIAYTCTPVTPPPAPQVHIHKYIDGVKATAITADNAAFPMLTTFDSSVYGPVTNAPFTLSPSGWGVIDGPYEASYVGGAAGDDYATNEVTGGAVVGASCADGKPFALVGYTTGDTLAAAVGGVPSLTAPSFTNLQSDKYVIVWNTKCPVLGSVSGMKFWDVNGNGVMNAGEPGLSGWTFNLVGPTAASQVTAAGGAYTFSNVAAGAYTVTENMQTGWTMTTAVPAFTLAAGENKTGVNIGNACFVGTGGKGKGYWTNKNGQATMNDGGTTAPELALLSGLNLRNAAGANFDPATYASYAAWNTGANAVNMAYMLSAQLSALVLSKEAGFIDGTKQIVITDPALASIPGMSPLGVITINDLITAANTELGLHGNTTTPSPFRAYQEALKNAVEKAADGRIQLCQPYTTVKTFTASNSSYYNGPTNAAPLYATGPFSFSWDPSTNLVTGGQYDEQIGATTYYNVITGGTVTGGNVFNLTFARTIPNVYGFNGSVMLLGNTVTGTFDGPYYFTATGTVTP